MHQVTGEIEGERRLRRNQLGLIGRINRRQQLPRRIGLFDVCRVVLSMMQLQRFGGAPRPECVVRIGQIGECVELSHAAQIPASVLPETDWRLRDMEKNRDIVPQMAEESSPLLKIEPIEGGFRLSGEVDASCIPSLSQCLNPLPGAGDITIHLAGVTFMDSSGLRELIDAHQRAERLDRRILMTDPSPTVVRLFEISGLSNYLHIA